MAALTSLVTAIALGVGAGSALKPVLNPSKAPKIKAPAPTTLIGAPPVPDAAAAEQAASDAAKLVRRRAASGGRSSTILTGPSGLPDAPTGARKTLLGL